MANFDLHTHTKFSDGTQSVAELVAEVAQSGLAGFALTDHDTAEGWDQARAEAAAAGLDFLPGMEVSCAVDGISVHVLAYGLDPTYQPLLAELELARTSRETRAQKMVELLSADYPLTWELVQEFVGQGATVGRPHIADALVKVGAVKDRSQAFAEILTPTSPYYVSHYAVHPVTAVELIRQAGGLPVMAHPLARSRGNVASLELIEQMIASGLGGLEVDHRDNSETDRVVLRELAAEYDLLVTGSSDYHGAGKPNRLGENTTAPEVVERLRQFMTIKS